jgi:predicted adenine nucleotide alpha hydrolase (AANH) superfamily ATPase
VAAEPDKRCGYCYASRLDAVAAAAKEDGFDAFTSSLFYSRYQNHELMRRKAEEAALQHGVPFCTGTSDRAGRRGSSAQRRWHYTANSIAAVSIAKKNVIVASTA